MIIECQACRARFKLDESRIKGKGARIRCRKCGESIIVMKSEIPAEKPSAPIGKELFDLRSILHEPERRAPVPSRTEVDAASQSPLRKEQEPETAAKESAEPLRVTASDFGKEVEAAFDRMLGRDRDQGDAAQEPVEFHAEVPPPPAAESDAPFESPPGPEPEGEPEPPFVTAETPPSAESEPEAIAQEPAESQAEVPPSPAAEINAPFESPPGKVPEGEPEPISITAETPALAESDAPSESPPGPEPEGEPETIAQEFEESFAEISPPRLSEVDVSFDAPLFGEEESRLPPRNGEILERDLREPGEKDALAGTMPGEEEKETARKPMEFLALETDPSEMLNKERAREEKAGSFDISEQLNQTPEWTLEEDAAKSSPPTEPQPFPGAATALRAETIQEELAGLAGSDFREEVFAPEPPPPDLSPAKPLEMERKPLTVPPRTSRTSRRPSVMLLGFLFVTLAAGGAYLAFTKTGQETLRTILPSIGSFWPGGKKSVRAYKVENPIAFYETGKDAEKLFVIKGAVTNQGRSPKTGIRVRAELLDRNQKSIGELTVYAGNVIPGLRSENRESIQASMANRFGDKLSNVDVAPGKSVPFMMVFVDPPEGIEEYRLEALEGE